MLSVSFFFTNQNPGININVKYKALKAPEKSQMLTLCKKFRFITDSDKVIEINYLFLYVINMNFLLKPCIFTESLTFWFHIQGKDSNSG